MWLLLNPQHLVICWQALRPGVGVQHKMDLMFYSVEEAPFVFYHYFDFHFFIYFFLEGGRVERKREKKEKEMNKVEWTGRWGGSGRS